MGKSGIFQSRGEGRGDFGHGYPAPCHLWEAFHQGRFEAVNNMFEGFGRDGHFAADNFKNISIGYSAGDVICHHHLLHVPFKMHGYFKEVSYLLLLLHHTVVRVDLHSVQFNAIHVNSGARKGVWCQGGSVQHTAQ